MRFSARKTLGGNLEPIDVVGREALAKFGVGDIVWLEAKQPRNVAHHRLFFALLSLIFENQSIYKSVEEMLDAIKVYVGYCNIMVLKNGQEVRVPKSISFAKMDQAQFSEFFNRVVDVVCTEIVPGLKREDLKREIIDMTGTSY